MSALAVFQAGCGQSEESQLRTSTPAEAAAKVMELYDADDDGRLATDEIKASPGLADGLVRIDVNRDGAIDESEMEIRFEAHDGLADLVAFEVRVTKNRTPLEGAEVTFTPELLMGEDKQAYAGTSGPGGLCVVKPLGDVPLPAVPTGYYSVHIVHAPSGVDVTRGCEVASDLPSPNRLEFDVGTTTVR
jgi:hypothetical protein